MIRELINFTENLIVDIPDIMQWNVQPSKGLHVFIDIDEQGKWANQNLELGKDYDYYDGKTDLSQLLEKTKVYQINSQLVNQDMNKCLDNDKYEHDGIIYPIKQIQSCSPYVVGFKVKEKKQDIDFIVNGKKKKEKKNRFDIIIKRAEKYLLKAIEVCKVNDLEKGKVSGFKNNIHPIIEAIRVLKINIGKKEVSGNDLSKSDFISIYINDITQDALQRSYSNYTTSKLFLKNEYNSEVDIKDSTFGLPSFFMIDNEGKPFLKHVTGVQYRGINGRVSAEQIKSLYKFNLLLKNGIFPNPLPIYIDKKEFKINSEIIKIFKNQNFDKYKYREIVEKIFEKEVKVNNYYLLNFNSNYIADFDFVTSFNFEVNQTIENVTEIKNANGNIKPTQKIKNVFELELEINKLFVKYNNNSKVGSGFLIGNYFGDKVETQKSFKNYTVKQETLASFYKYRKSIYDYIYKSRRQNLPSSVIDEIMLSAIAADIATDEYKNKKHNRFFSIREKINFWFSLYNLFEKNNLKIKNMVSKIEELKQRVRNIAENETLYLSSNEEFAFAAGQIASYLIEQSEASNKTYALLESYLQKKDSNQLQSEILRSIENYKHKLKFYNGNKYAFERLSADVLTFDESVKMDGIKKFFLAGCFCPSMFRK